MTAIRRDPTYPNVLRRPNGRWISIGNDPTHPWVLIGIDGMPVERFEHKIDALTRRKECGGRVVDTRRHR